MTTNLQVSHTDDLYFSAWLRVLHPELTFLGCKPNGDPNWLVFLFEDASGQFDSLKQEFDSSGARQLFNSYCQLRSVMNKTLDKNTTTNRSTSNGRQYQQRRSQ